MNFSGKPSSQDMAIIKGHHVVREKMAEEIKRLRLRVTELERELEAVKEGK